MKEQITKQLNNRQWVLYLYLKYQAEENNGWKKRIDILRDLSEYYSFNKTTNKKIYTIINQHNYLQGM